ncbi:MAG: hypothetical protein EXR96_06775 [Nitrospiraceae bacterium]|nr:hypothetical protein [Nitrospiraceae bacterium]
MRTGMIVAGLWLLTLTGCAGKGEMVALNLHAIPPVDAPKMQLPADTIVVVADFEDGRPDKQRAGTRTHQGGGETLFNVPGGKVGAVVAQAVTDYLKKRGWRVELARPVSGTGPDGGPHVTIAGRVVELSANAASTFGSTKITASAKTVIEAVNAEDGSIVRMTLSGAGSQTVVWFDTEDAAVLLSAALSESLEKFVAETKIEKKMLRLK